ncbi:MAG TPA: hypothetical protein VLH13_02215 [Methanomassiliicoccales archaeon]|nr:hypothetical protein [Methanomassiliicoccales archaeon]
MSEWICLITDAPDGPSANISKDLMVQLDRRILQFDLCGSSWTERPKSLVVLAFNSFNPLICKGDSDEPPSVRLLSRMDWLLLYQDRALVLRTSEIMPLEVAITLPNECLLIIASSRAINKILGTSLVRWYDMHQRVIIKKGEKIGMMIDDVDLPSSSPLLQYQGVGDMIELLVLPPPGRYLMASSFYDDLGAYNELRCYYVRRVHQALGCQRHGVW